MVGCAFTQLPPALAAASSLRRLELIDCPGLQLSEQALSAMSPQLRTLLLSSGELESLPAGQYLRGEVPMHVQCRACMGSVQRRACMGISWVPCPTPMPPVSGIFRWPLGKCQP